MTVGAWVPDPGHATHSRQVNADATKAATIEIRTKVDGTVIARCS